MNEYISLILSIFIVYRLAIFLTIEEGPFYILVALRTLVKWYLPFWVYKGVNCPLCTGFWLSFIPAIFLADSFNQWLVYSIGIAGAQTFLTLVGGIPDGEEE